MRSELRAVRTGGVPTVVDLTDECAEFVRQEADGLLHVFVPHATAGIAILETGSGSDDDLLAQLDVLLPRDDRWRHRHGSAGHGRDHVLPAFVPPHASVPGARGADAARHLAAHLPGRHQHRQPRPARPVLLPRGLSRGPPLRAPSAGHGRMPA